MRLIEINVVDNQWVEPQVVLATDVNEAIFKIKKPWKKGLRTKSQAQREFR